MINKSRKLRNDQFYPEVHVKDSIFLHHTAGTTAAGAIDWWNQTPDHVGVAYVIDRDGTIFETFDDTRWGYHLGVKGDDNYMEKHSIGIEIVAAGDLEKIGDDFYFFPLKPLRTQRKLIPASDVITLKKEWRGSKYYQKYTDEQIAALAELIPYLIAKHKMPIEKIAKNWMDYQPEILKEHTPGIWSHTSVREDKNDVMNQPELLEMLAGLSF